MWKEFQINKKCPAVIRGAFKYLKKLIEIKKPQVPLGLRFFCLVKINYLKNLINAMHTLLDAYFLIHP